MTRRVTKSELAPITPSPAELDAILHGDPTAQEMRKKRAEKNARTIMRLQI